MTTMMMMNSTNAPASPVPPASPPLPLPSPSPLSACSVSSIKGEIHSVLTLVRLSSFDFSTSPSSASDWRFQCFLGNKSVERELNEFLTDFSPFSSLDVSAFLSPFLRLLANNLQPARKDPALMFPIAAALHSIHKFFLSSLFHSDSPSLGLGLSRLIEALASVLGVLSENFLERPGEEDSQLCLMKALEIFLECFRLFSLEIPSASAIEAFRAILKLRHIAHLAGLPLLRRFTENILLQVTFIAFQAIPDYQAETPYAWIFGQFIEFLHSGASSDSERVLGLRLIRTVLESAGTRVGKYPQLIQLIQEELCKRLLALGSTGSNLFILSLVLRLIFDLFSSVRQHLKVQLEVFFTSIHLRLGASPSSSFQQRQLVLESLIEFCKEPNLIVGLFRNYDSEVGSTDLFQDLCKFLASFNKAHNITQQGPAEENSPDALPILAAEAILAIVKSLHRRFCSSGAAAEDGEAFEQRLILNDLESQSILQQQANKKLLALASERFNQEGGKSLKFLQSLGILSEPLSGQEIAEFFVKTPGLNKTQIGEFLGGPDRLQLETLEAFVGKFDFSAIQNSHGERFVHPGIGSWLDDALREFLELFKLPGEAQCIARVLEKFSHGFYGNELKACQTPIFASSDTCFVLCYAIIMLNTDAHNPQVLKKMSRVDFCRNLRQINAGADLPEEFLHELYHSITHNEIRLNTAAGQNSIARTGIFEISAPRIHGREMFLIIAQPALASFTAFLESFILLDRRAFSAKDWRPPSDPLMQVELKFLAKLLAGLESFSSICRLYSLTDCFNSALIALCRISCRALEEIEGAVGNSANSIHAAFSAFNSAEASKFSLSAFMFSHHSALQLLLSAVFSLVDSFGPSLLQDGWSNLLDLIQRLRSLGLIQHSWELEDFRDSNGRAFDSLNSGDSRQAVEIPSSSGKSSLDFLLGFFLSEASEEFEYSSADREVQQKLFEDSCEILRRCEIPKLFNRRDYEGFSLKFLVRALCESSELRGRDGENQQERRLSEARGVFALERLADVIEANQQRLGSFIVSGSSDLVVSVGEPGEFLSSEPVEFPLWPVLFNHLERQIVNAPTDPNYFLERLVVQILRFSIRLVSVGGPAQAVKLLRLLLLLSPLVLNEFAPRLIAGAQLFLHTHGDSLKDRSAWEILVRLLITFRVHSDSAFPAFHALSQAAHKFLSPVNFSLLVDSAAAFLSPAKSIGPADKRGKSKDKEKELLFSTVPPSTVFDLLRILHTRLFSLADPQANPAAREQFRCESWLALIRSFSALCGDSRQEVRKLAMEALQLALLSDGQRGISAPLVWRIAMENFLLPMLEKVAAAEQVDPPLDSQLVRASNLLFQCFLRESENLLRLGEFHLFWLKFLGSLERHLKASTAQRPVEAGAIGQYFIENLKNVLLVLVHRGAFTVFTERTGQDLFQLTWRIIDAFRPDLREQLEGIKGMVKQKNQTENNEKTETEKAAESSGGLPAPSN